MRTIFSSAIRAISVLFIVAWAGTAWATEKTFGPFLIDDSNPDIIALKGEIDIGSALNFRRALHAAPNAKLITLKSPGGNVQMALLIADDIRQRELSTYIAKDDGCYSACAYLFLAGGERQADGELGVHQISSDSPDLVGAQLTISDIIDMLNHFDTPIEVLSVMFKTPPNEMHVFTPAEIEQYKLNRKNSGASTQPAVSGLTTTPVATPPATNGGPPQGGEGNPTPAVTLAAQPTASAPVVGAPPQAKLSAIEEFTNRPNRIAIYTGLDLFGDDLTSIRTQDAAECAQSCLVMNGQCKAFTFNSNPKVRKAPNCFLKSSAGRADGNSVAFSGRFLSGADTDPSTLTLGTIDPQSALFHDIDLPGGDLARYPYIAAKTALDCRLSCIDDNRCVAFTYNYSKKQCWLKGAIGTPMPGKGMVSGVKKLQSFSPAKIISLN